MNCPALELLGAPPDEVERLLMYVERAAWKVRVANKWFVVKADTRDGMQRKELDAQNHAGGVGVPVPEVVAAIDRPIPAMAMKWVDGLSLHKHPSTDAWRDAGRVLRMAHGASVMRPRSVPWGDLVLTWLKSDLPYLVHRHGLTAVDCDAALRRADGLRSRLNRCPLVWLHGDCQAEHFIIDPTTERVVALVDWADAAEGDAAMDFAILTLFDDGVLGQALDAYGASTEFHDHVLVTLPLYRAVRGAGAARWLDEHGYRDVAWPVEAVREFIR